MYEQNNKEEILLEVRSLLERIDSLEEDKDALCQMMKSLILNTYSEN